MDESNDIPNKKEIKVFILNPHIKYHTYVMWNFLYSIDMKTISNKKASQMVELNDIFNENQIKRQIHYWLFAFSHFTQGAWIALERYGDYRKYTLYFFLLTTPAE